MEGLQQLDLNSDSSFACCLIKPIVTTDPSIIINSGDGWEMLDYLMRDSKRSYFEGKL